MSKTANCLKSYKRSWTNHFGTQVATVTVLTGTFTILIMFLSVSMNLKRILGEWGQTLNLTVFLREDISPHALTTTEKTLKDFPEIESLQYISKDNARTSFSQQLAQYAPDLLTDPDFDSAFPASFQMRIKKSYDSSHLVSLAKRSSALEGVEDVAYGQDWVENYSSFVKGLRECGWIMSVLLMLASLFVIGNSIRVSIFQRIEEIEILDLVGATQKMIRLPFVFEGVMTGLISVTFSLLLGWAGYHIQLKYLVGHPALIGIVAHFRYLNFAEVLLVIASGIILGGFGANLCLRQVNYTLSSQRRVNSA